MLLIFSLSLIYIKFDIICIQYRLANIQSDLVCIQFHLAGADPGFVLLCK